MLTKKIGVVGAGAISSSMHIPVIRAMADADIAWVMDATEERAKSVADSHGLKHLPLGPIDRGGHIDAVLLAIPLPPRGRYFEQIKGTNIGLLVEKPLANSLLEHDRLEKDFQPWQIATGYQRRYYAQFGLVKKIIETGVLGPLKQITHSEGGRVMRSGGGGEYQSVSVAQGGGIIKNLGCHSLDLILWITNAQEVRTIESDIQWDDETDLGCNATFEIRSNTQGTLPVYWNVSWLDNIDNQTRFHFNNAILSCPVSPTEAVELRDMNRQLIGVLDAKKQGATTSAQAFYLEWRDMLDALVARSPQFLSSLATRPAAALMADLLGESNGAKR